MLVIAEKKTHCKNNHIDAPYQQTADSSLQSYSAFRLYAVDFLFTFLAHLTIIKYNKSQNTATKFTMVKFTKFEFLNDPAVGATHSI